MMTILAALIHEGGHFLYMLYISESKVKVRSALSGFRMKMNSHITYKEEILLCFFGPGANLIISALFGLIPFFSAKVFPSLSPAFVEWCALFSLFNLATAFSNLLPIEGYDGYRMLRAYLEDKGRFTLVKALERFSSALIFFLCLFSLYLIDRLGGGYWIFAVFFISMIKSISKDIS